MNSVAPISSLAETLKNRLQQSVGSLNNDSGSVDDLEIGIELLKEEAKGFSNLLKHTETLIKLRHSISKKYM